MPLSLRIVIAVVLGTLTAGVLGPHAAPLGDASMLVIRLLKALAAPLVFLAVLDAILQYEIPARKGARLLLISGCNACVAILIGFAVSHTLRFGRAWRGQIDVLLREVASRPAASSAPAAVSLDPVANLAHYVPESLLDPFLHNNVIAIVALAILCGFALRRVRTREEVGTAALAQIVRAALQAVMQVLSWVVGLIPFAVFGIVASVVARTGLRVFGILAPFLATILIGLTLHALAYYPVLIRVFGHRSPWKFFVGGMDAIVTALSSGSSLATLPVTLRCLNDNLRVSPDCARLAACVATNLNHDGIILYEAGAAIFVTQALGLGVGLGQQVSIAAAAVMAGIGIAGVPDAGLITLPLVLGAARLPEHVVATVIPLLLPVDWIIGRCRAATNVISDMTVAVLLEPISRERSQEVGVSGQSRGDIVAATSAPPPGTYE